MIARTALAVAGLALVAACSSDPDIAAPATVTGSTDAPADGDVLIAGEGSTIDPPPTDSTADDSAATATECDTAQSQLVPADWPFLVTDAIIVSQTQVDGGSYSLTGLTSFAELVVGDTIDGAFPGFDVAEPTGGDQDIAVAFTALNADAVLRLDDADADGCWQVVIEADYRLDDEPTDPSEGGEGGAPTVTLPADSAETVPTDADEPVDTVADVPAVASTVPQPEPIDPLDSIDAVGTGVVQTGRGSFPIQLSVCSIDPLRIDAVAAGGVLSISGDPSSVVTTWTYDDGVVITSDESKVLGLAPQGGTIVADGENPDGPETLFIDFVCSGT